MKNSSSIIASSTIPEIFVIHKACGERKRCRLVHNGSDVPSFLLEAGAVRINHDNTATMMAVEGPATREFPFFLCWEETNKLNCGYGTWPKDNGWDTLFVTPDGRCFDKAADNASMPRYKACRLTHDLPEYFRVKKSITIDDSGTCHVETSWGETRKSKLPENGCNAVLVEYEDGGVNILTLSEPSAHEYLVELNGKDTGKLVDLIS